MSKPRFRKLFITSGYIQKLNENHVKFPQSDSSWVEQTETLQFNLQVQERGSIVFGKLFNTYDDMIDYFTDWIYDSYN